MQCRGEALGERRGGYGRRGWFGGGGRLGDGRLRSLAGRIASTPGGRTEELSADDECDDHGGSAEADGDDLVHLGKPPRAKNDPLSCLFSAIADRVERLVGQLGRAA